MTEELFQRFFRQECTPEEERQVREYLRRHWANLENEVSEEDWASFNEKDTMPPVISEKMLSVIDDSIHTKKTRLVYFRWASAAALVLLSLAAWKWITWHPHTDASPAIAASQPPAMHEWKERVNNTGKTMGFILPDNSKVELADKSSIRYVDSFTTTDRALYLKGKALFAVASDHTRPFTVYAGRLSTTALGTVFSVSWPGDSSAATEVRLHSGKVVIRPDSLLHSRGIKDTYLDPGQQLKFDPIQLTVLVHTVQPKPAIARVEKPRTEDVLKFNDTPLKDIFSALEKQYHCTFDYKKEDVDDIRFTGNFNTKKETLSDFLNTIALLNNLTLTEKNNTFYLR